VDRGTERVRLVQTMTKDEKYIHLTHVLAERGRGSTSPNPVVGALVVNHGIIISMGYHQAFGGPHAEVVALRKYGSHTKGATLYVSLEPCCHWGKTAPCTDLIIRSGIKRVVCSTIDPNPLVNGKGIRRLKKAGIKVDVGILEEDAKKLNEAYFKYITTRIPFVTLKVAGSLNGKVSSVYGDTVPVDFDAILWDVGKINPPHLNPLPDGERKIGRSNPKIILSGTWNEISNCLRKSKSIEHQSIILAPIDDRTKVVKRNADLKIWKLNRRKNGELDLIPFLKKCGKEEITSLLVEGGSVISTSFLKQKLVDKIWYKVFPKVSVKGEGPFGDLGIKKMSDAIVIKNCKWKRSGNNLLAVGYPGF
jgi:diaminohydroxyphosphoribosylaminopyrimidine deaminase / 5-amino-6-(5-phosphoribosylamino)uracil reductase